jgi:hypothetical protein
MLDELFASAEVLRQIQVAYVRTRRPWAPAGDGLLARALALWEG